MSEQRRDYPVARLAEDQPALIGADELPAPADECLSPATRTLLLREDSRAGVRVRLCLHIDGPLTLEREALLAELEHALDGLL